MIDGAVRPANRTISTAWTPRPLVTVTRVGGRSPDSRVLRGRRPSQPGHRQSGICQWSFRAPAPRLQLRGQSRFRPLSGSSAPCSLLIPWIPSVGEPSTLATSRRAVEPSRILSRMRHMPRGNIPKATNPGETAPRDLPCGRHVRHLSIYRRTDDAIRRIIQHQFNIHCVLHVDFAALTRERWPETIIFRGGAARACRRRWHGRVL